MKTVLKAMTVVTLLGTLACGLLTGCSLGKPTVKLNDYVTVEEEGFDGYGTIRASIDYEQILEDYGDRLKDNVGSQLLGEQTPEAAAMFVIETLNPYELSYEKPENAKNGDKVEISWTTSAAGIQQLSGILDVKFKYDNFEYELKDLKPLVEVDPFENVNIPHGGIEGGIYSSAAYVYTSNMTTTFTAGDQTVTLNLTTEVEDGKVWHNGDSLHVSISQESYSADNLAKKYGVILSRTETDIVLDDFAYYTSDPQDVFDNLGEDSKENAMSAIKSYMKKSYTNNGAKDFTYELVGMVYFYNDQTEELDERNSDNQLVLIYHIDNGPVPGGWYSYISPSDDIVIDYQTMDDGSKNKIALTDAMEPLYNSHVYYHKELTISAWMPHPTCFTYGESTLLGHQTVEECVDAFIANQLRGQEYDHMSVSEELADNEAIAAMVH